jgi:hypothetical protein
MAHAERSQDVQADVTAPFSTFSPFASRMDSWLAILIHVLAHGEDENIKRVAFLHHARWTRITRRALKKAGFSPAELPPWGALLFVSAFNGEGSTYIRGFSEKLGDKMNALWGGCVNWTDARKLDELFDFIGTYSRPIDLFYNAYEHTATELRAALRLRSRVDALVELADLTGDAEDDDAFKKRYLEVAQEMWGNGPVVP